MYSDSESEEEEHGNGDTPLPLQEEVDHPPKDALNSEKPSHQLPEKTEDQEGCVLCCAVPYVLFGHCVCNVCNVPVLHSTSDSLYFNCKSN